MYQDVSQSIWLYLHFLYSSISDKIANNEQLLCLLKLTLQKLFLFSFYAALQNSEGPYCALQLFHSSLLCRFYTTSTVLRKKVNKTRV